MMKLVTSILLVSLFLSPMPYPLYPTFAATSTSTPSADLKTKLQTLQSEIASRAAKIKSEIGKKLQNKVYVGYIKSKSETSLTLATKSDTQIINLNPDTQYSGKSKTTLKTLNNDDYIASLGDIDDTGILTARKIIKLSSLTNKNLQTIWGLVVGISDNEVTITNKVGKTVTIQFDKKTDFKFGDKRSSISDVKMNKGVVAVGTSPKNGFITARLIYIQPYSSSYTPKVASASATPTSPVKKK